MIDYTIEKSKHDNPYFKLTNITQKNQKSWQTEQETQKAEIYLKFPEHFIKSVEIHNYGTPSLR